MNVPPGTLNGVQLFVALFIAVCNFVPGLKLAYKEVTNPTASYVGFGMVVGADPVGNWLAGIGLKAFAV